MTVTMLLCNTFESAKNFYNEYQVESEWNINYLHLDLKNPVPEDIIIAKTHKPKEINKLAREIRLFENEYECYGRNKAKVCLSVLNRLENRTNGNYVVVAGINPTPLGKFRKL